VSGSTSVAAAARTVAPSAASFEGRAMGSPLRLQVHGEAFSRSPALAERAWAAVVDEFERSNVAMSRFLDSSELTVLNRAAGSGRATAVFPRLRRALVISDRARRVTDGRFDSRVVGALERIGYSGAELPSPVTSAPLEGQAVHLDRTGRVTIDAPIDLGGIGKGLAVRWAAARLDALLADRGAGWSGNGALLDAGGDLVVRGSAPDGGPWQIGIEDPWEGSEPCAVVAIESGAVATSSVRRLRWATGDRVVHHLIDPRTGEPAETGLVAVTVAAPDPAWAEVWSKTLFIAGRTEIADLARSRALAAWWIAEDGAVEMTPAARQRTIWLAAEA
jgi:thiamine biosynthesis lipoprotein